MKEDAQLICPASYEDPNEIWAKLEKILIERLPLRDVTWKSPISSSYITIDKLPLRCLPSSANLFKDTDHAFRWFLAPYINLYLLSAETIDAYKNSKMNIKKWVDLYNGAKKSPWLIVYIPSGSVTVDAYSKIYSRLCNDFYGDRTGDRSVMLISCPQVIDDSTASFGVRHGNNTATLNLIQQSNNSVSDLLSKMREGIVVSFQHRSAMYDSDIRRLDSYRGTTQFDFRTLFLVKESLALMYQMMQLPDKALGQYEELEATLSYAPDGVLLESSDWPMVSSEPLKPTAAEGASGLEDASPHKTSSSAKTVRVKDALSDACKNGEDVVAYSINLARMKILQKKMSMLELHRYVFARQMFFLLSHLERPVQCAEKALSFMQQSSALIERRLEERYRQNIRQHQAALSSKAESATASEYAAASEVTASLTRTCQLREKQANLWVLTASVKIIRVCRDLTAKIISRSAAVDGELKNLSSDVVSHAVGSENDIRENSTLVPSAAAGAIIKESSRVLGELMQFAVAKLQMLVPRATGAGLLRKSIALALDSGIRPWSCEERQDFSAEFLVAMEKELSQAGFDQDSLSNGISALPSDNNLLVSVALKIRASSTIWAVEFASPVAEVEPNKTVSTLVLSSSPSAMSQTGPHPLQDDCSSPSVLLNRQPSGGITVAAPSLSSVQLSVTEKAIIQEVSLIAMVLKAQWELLQLAGRSRFVIASQLQCADLFMCFGMSWRAIQLMELVVRSGLLVSPSNVPAPILSAASLLSRSAAPEIGSKDYRLTAQNRAGDWLEMRFWLLRKLLYCAEQARDGTRFRLLALQLLHPDIQKGVARCPTLSSMDLSQLRIALQTSVLALSSPHSTLGELQLPLSAFFHVSVMAEAPAHSCHSDVDCSGLTVLSAIRGFEVVLDEIHPVTALQCTGGMPGYVVTLRLHSSLPIAFETNRLVVVYRRFNADQVMNQSGTGNSLLSLPSTPLTSPQFVRDRTDSDSFPPSPFPSHHLHQQGLDPSADCFSLGEDEFVCEPLLGQITRIESGEQFIQLKFVPPAIGEYRLDRVALSSGSLLFSENMLSSSCLHERDGFSTLGGGPASLLPHSHLQLQAYFDEHLLIKVAAPSDLLRMQASTPTFSPLGQSDELCVQFETGSSESLHDLTVTARHNPSIIAYDDSASVGTLQSPTSPLRQQPLATGSDSSFYEQQSLLTPNRRQGQSLDDSSNARTAMLGEILVHVVEADKWRVQASAKDNGTEDSTHWRPTSTDSLNFDRVESSRALSLVIPFTPSRTGAVSALKGGQCSKLSDDMTSTTTVTVVLSGRMERNGCSIVFELTTNFRISTGEALSVTVADLTPSSGRSPVSVTGVSQERFVQAVVRNICPVTVILMGCEVRGGASVVDGPQDFDQGSEGNDLLLAPGEAYCAGFILAEKSDDSSDVSVEFSYHRQEATLTDSVSAVTTSGGLFTKKVILLTRDRDVSSSIVHIRPVEHLNLRAAAIPPQLSATVGQVQAFWYVLEFQHLQSNNPIAVLPTAKHNLWSYSDRLVSNESSDRTLLHVSEGSVRNLSVTICDTDCWLVAGPKRRMLFDKSLVRGKSLESEAPQTGFGSSDVSSFRFELEVLLVPVTTGNLSLPPLMVTYQCSRPAVDLFVADSDDDDDEMEGGDRQRNEEVACLLYHNALLGPSTVSVSSAVSHEIGQTIVDDDLISVEF